LSRGNFHQFTEKIVIMTLQDKYPKLRTYIGRDYFLAGGPRLLLVGESHYFPRDSKIHLDPERWYAGNWNMLNQTEQSWISTCEIISESREKSFSEKAHSIWKRSFQVINENGPHYEDFRNVADDIAYFNFFQRPANCGESLCVHSLDIAAAKDNWIENYKKLQPRHVVFLSMLAYSHYNSMGLGQAEVVPHPGCNWWTRRTKKYGGLSGREKLAQIVQKIDCPRWRDVGARQV